MKKAFFVTMVLMTIVGSAALNVHAQTWSWEVSTTTILPNVLEITANTVDDSVYGMDETGSPVILDTTYTTTGAEATAGDTSPVVDIVVGTGGIVYVISGTAVSTWDPISGEYALLDPQPTIPVGTTGTYKLITVGKDGELYVLFETETSDQYLLKGYPSYFTDGVVVDFNPTTLNLSSKGNYINCKINLPSDYEEADIDPATLMITKIEVTGVGSVEDLAILRAPDSPCGFDPEDECYKVKFSRSYKKIGDETQSLIYQLEQLMTGQNKGKYDVTLTLEGSLDGSPTKFQGESSFKAMVTKKTK